MSPDNRRFQTSANGATWGSVKVFLCLILALLPSLAFSSEPGPAALDFLEKARKGDLDLDPGGDTALQANSTTAGKLRTIRKAIERLGDDLGDGELEVGEVKEDERYAAVMVRKVGGFDSSEVGVYPVALVKHGEQWFPAPVLASFENAVAGYTLSVSERLSVLEAWMMRKRVVELKTLIELSAESTRERIRKSVIGENLEGDDIEAIGKAFIQACKTGDRAAILGFLGGLSSPLPEDWSARLAVSRLAVDGRGPWRLLVAPEVVRVPVLAERTNGSGNLSIACLDPSIGGSSGNAGKIRIIHIDLEKDGSGLWRMDLPQVLMSANEDLLEESDGFDVDLLDSFAPHLREVNPAIATAIAREAEEGVLEAVKSGSLRELLQRVDFGKSAKDARAACDAAARLWWTINEPGAFRLPVELGFEEHGDSAIAVFQWFSVNDADRYVPVTMFFEKSPAGWMWCPGIVSVDDLGEYKELSNWVRKNEPTWRLTWREKLIASGMAVERLDFQRLATDSEVRGLMGEWMGALKARDIGRAISVSAWFRGEGEIPMKALRNLSYDLTNFREGKWKLEGIHRSESWVAASVRQSDGNKVRNAFIPVVVTPSGPRLLPEIDLFAEKSRTRSFLNESSFERMGKFAAKERVAELKELFGSFGKSLTSGK